MVRRTVSTEAALLGRWTLRRDKVLTKRGENTMWKRRVSVFLIVCLLCGLIPAHAADVPGHPDMGDMPVWEETEP